MGQPLLFFVSKRIAPTLTGQGAKKKRTTRDESSALLSGYCDSNTGPSGPKPDALANCATPR